MAEKLEQWPMMIIPMPCEPLTTSLWNHPRVQLALGSLVSISVDKSNVIHPLSNDLSDALSTDLVNHSSLTNPITATSALSSGLAHPTLSDLNKETTDLADLNKETTVIADLNKDNPIISDLNKETTDLADLQKDNPTSSDLNKDNPVMADSTTRKALENTLDKEPPIHSEKTVQDTLDSQTSLDEHTEKSNENNVLEGITHAPADKPKKKKKKK